MLNLTSSHCFPCSFIQCISNISFTFWLLEWEIYLFLVVSPFEFDIGRVVTKRHSRDLRCMPNTRAARYYHLGDPSIGLVQYGFVPECHMVLPMSNAPACSVSSSPVATCLSPVPQGSVSVSSPFHMFFCPLLFTSARHIVGMMS